MKIIIDTDPGQDDAIAILLALASPELDLLGITTVAGNVPLALTTLNARRIVSLAGRTDVPIRSGAAAPLQRPLVTAEHVHGKTGLDGWDWPEEPEAPLAGEDAAEWIVRTVMDAPEGSVTLCPLGPLTNIARAMAIEPALAGRLERIVLMGGGYFEGGNITPMAEFNIYVDPHAADAVMRSGARIVMAPLDVTHKALMQEAFLESLRALRTEVGNACAGMLDFFERFDMEKYGASGGPLHDPCVIAWLLKPDLFTGRDCFVAIETESDLCLGATVVDWWNVWPERAANAHVLGDIDADGFFALLIERLSRL
ncbi:MAG: nucleoside hydrolase [Pseudomonadota bacterium]